MTESTSARAGQLRRGLFLAIGVAAVVLGAVVALRIDTLLPGTAVAASGSPSIAPTASPVAVPAATLAPSEQPPTAPPPTPIPTPPMVAGPLTGLLVSPEAALQHPIAVMVDDHADARPQSGFNAASIVWHAPAEGGVPGYMMIFQDKIPAGVGPIRSSREYYIEWAAEWRAMYVHHGGSPQALETLRNHGGGSWVYNADGFRWSPRFLWRTDDRAAPHNVYTDGAHLRQLAAKLGADDATIKPIWDFGRALDPRIRPVGGSITVIYPYETITYRYDTTTNRYLRYINGSKKPQVDAADGQVVAPTNVVILRMFFGPLNDGHPTKHRLEAQNVGKGEAWISTNGVTIKGQWRKASETAPTRLFGSDGKPITLAAGQTFVQVLALNYDFSFKKGVVPVFVPPMQALRADRS